MRYHIVGIAGAGMSAIAHVLLDQGHTADDLARVLKPFEQVDSTFSRAHQGTGLGLPLVKAIMELHSGTLELLSESTADLRVFKRDQRGQHFENGDLAPKCRKDRRELNTNRRPAGDDNARRWLH